MTLHISATKSVANGYSCSYSISSKQISSVVGFSVTGTSSVTIEVIILFLKLPMEKKSLV